MTLEELIQETAKRGELNYLSLIPTRKGWSATYAKARNCEHTLATHADPVEALKAALATRRRKPSSEIDFG